MPPVVAAPTFAIRKPAVAVFTLDDYVAARIMTAWQAGALVASVATRKNILVAGGTSTGKTTLTNALLAEVAKSDDRVVLIEDTRELQCAAPNLVSLRTKDGVASLSDLVRSALRLRPDRIPIGEVRGAEALDLLKAWGTGHPGGVGTIHAGSALGTLRRMEQLIQESVVTVPRALIADPPRVMRLSRKAIGIASACGFALVGGALIYALQPEGRKGADELYNTDGVAVADNLAGAPKDYGQVPKLGPPLPGDLGKPILDAQRRGDIAALPPIGAGPPSAPSNPAATAADTARQRAEQEREAARGSRLFFGGGSPANGSTGLVALPPPEEAPAVSPATAPQSDAARKQAFLERGSDRRTVSTERLSGLASPSILQAGSVIPAALITGIRSDLPGLVTAQVTQNVYDSPTGRILLIPQGSRLIGDYDADVAFGQSRILLAWNRLILPDGRSIVLDRQPAADPRGFAGLQDGTNYHWGGVLKAALVSTLLGVGSELGAGSDSDLTRAVRRGTQDSINRAGEQIVSRELNVRPTLTIRPGFPVRVLVTRDLVLGGGQ